MRCHGSLSPFESDAYVPCFPAQVQNAQGASSVRIVSIDDCYMQEKTELVKNPETGKREKVTRMVYEVCVPVVCVLCFFLLSYVSIFVFCALWCCVVCIVALHVYV